MASPFGSARGSLRSSEATKTGIFRVVFFIPYIVAPTVNAEIWRYILNPLHGIGAQLERHLGWEWANVGFFTERFAVP